MVKIRPESSHCIKATVKKKRKEEEVEEEDQFFRSTFFFFLLSCGSPEYKWKTLGISKPISESLKSAIDINSRSGNAMP